MTRYHNIDELDARIERIISRTVKAYYTDWKNYDRPKYMTLKGSRNRKDKQIILIARACGTYLYTLDDISKREWPTSVYKYYQTSSESNYYYINLDNLSIEKINPATYQIETFKEATA